MNSLVLFAVAALFGSVHCDEDCFGAAIKECTMNPVPSEGMRLCDEVKDQTECLSEMLERCDVHIWIKALDLEEGIQGICDDDIKNYFDEDKACYMKVINDSVCVEPINEAMGDIKTTEDLIRANKKVCNLFEPYSSCVQEDVEKNCNRTVLSIDLFNDIHKPLRGLSNSLCEQLIVPADEDSRPDNFGKLNVHAFVAAIFASG
ncbi:hypothetical protein AVEN_122421-1 [Araneus ventricosus]|uniref:DUF19 domain-containing protein n=1 Tax=Araneus ventricosus TaxID=182803 RepID=A0A4Y2JZD8_ARAVE|nr:hypothetical protein AVEN_122421-1 [Araneus ventricosus]